MKITTFDPIIITQNKDDIVKLFEELGFEKTHAPVTETENGDVHSQRMKYPDGGYHVDVAQSPRVQSDKTYIRMNVDNFQEAYDIMVKHGFKNVKGDGNTLETNHAVEATMVSPSGFVIALVKHIKNDE